MKTNIRNILILLFLLANILYSKEIIINNDLKEVIPYANNSQLKLEISNEETREHLEVALSKKELKSRQKKEK